MAPDQEDILIFISQKIQIPIEFPSYSYINQT